MQPYTAKGILRDGHAHTLLASSVVRKFSHTKQEKLFAKNAQQKIIDAGDGARLSAQFNLHTNNTEHCVVLLHGWLGCSESRYVIALGTYLYNQGCNVVRLNFRDHGFTEHLNQGLFHSCRIQEVINACISIQKILKQPLSLIGFSLGANFALRVNAFTSEKELQLNRTIAYCPVMDPSHTLDALEHSLKLYSSFFIRTWKQSFRRKIKAFPNIYSADILKNFNSLRNATEHLAIHYAGFESLSSYLSGYAVIGQRLKTLRSQSFVVLAKDDPIIPWQDHQKLAAGPMLEIMHCDHGGHCGFLDANMRSSWVDKTSLAMLS